MMAAISRKQRSRRAALTCYPNGALGWSCLEPVFEANIRKPLLYIPDALFIRASTPFHFILLISLATDPHSPN